MRNHPIEAAPWELEAARRREVIQSDFGAPRAQHRIDRDETLRPGAVASHIRRLAGWVAALARADGPGPVARIDHESGCQPGVHAVRPGS